MTDSSSSDEISNQNLNPMIRTVMSIIFVSYIYMIG